MFIKRFYPFLLLFTAFLGSCANKAADATEEQESSESVNIESPPGFQSFIAASDGFGLAVPANWEIQENFSGTRLMAKSPLSGDNDLFQENINVIVQSLVESGVSNLEQYVQLSEKQLKDFITDFELMESKQVDWVGKEAHEFIYTGTQGAYILKWHQRILLNDNKAYVFSYTALPDTYNQHIAIVDMILNTFTFSH